MLWNVTRGDAGAGDGDGVVVTRAPVTAPHRTGHLQPRMRSALVTERASGVGARI